MIFKTPAFCFCYLLVFFNLVSTENLVPLSGVNGKIDEETQRCVSYSDLITDVVMTSTMSLIAENSFASVDQLSSTIFSPTSFFDVVYLNQASSIEYKKMLLTLTYVNVDSKQQVDCNQLRSNLYGYVNSESFRLARSTLGKLLLVTVDNLAQNSRLWKNYRCLPLDQLTEAELAISVELSKLRYQIGELTYGLFLDFIPGTTLAFAIDDTGSMEGEIGAAKQRVEMITNNLRGSVDRPQEYVLVPFNDPFVYDVTHTRDADVFKRALRRLYAYGGGDAPEMCLTGISVAIEKSRPGSTIYVITDVDAKDFELQDSVIAQANHKQITVVFLLTNGLEHCATGQQYNGKMKICRKLYEYIAKKTGGQVLVVTKNQILRATEIIQTRLVQGLIVLQKQHIKVDDDENFEMDIEIDSSIKQIVLEATGKCGDIQLITPKGDIPMHLKRFDKTLSGSVKVDTHFGIWSLVGARESEEVDCQVKVSAKTSFGIIMTVLQKQKTQSPDNYKVLVGLPLYTDSTAIFIDFYGEEIIEQSRGDRVSRVRFVDEDGNDVISAYNISSSKQDARFTIQMFITDGFTIKIRPFYVIVEGVIDNVPFTRYSSQLITVSHIDIKSDFTELEVSPGSKTTLRYIITNKGTTKDIFRIDAGDDEGFVRMRKRSLLRLDPGQSKVIVVDLKLPVDVVPGTTTKITITAKGSGPGAFQYFVNNVVVGNHEVPKIESFTIRGSIFSRFAETVITSKVRNHESTDRLSQFRVVLPPDSFIANFTMKLKNETIIGKIELKENAVNSMQEQTTAMNGAKVYLNNLLAHTYETNMVVPAHESVIFQLTYHQVLKRKNGKFGYVLAVSPDQPVNNLQINVDINQHEAIKFVSVTGFSSDQLYPLESRNEDERNETQINFSSDRRSCHVTFSPSFDHKQLSGELSGKYVIQFDVDRNQIFGQSLVADKFFAHFFSAPSFANPPKMVVYVINICTSLGKQKFEQVKQALRYVLLNLNEKDYFNIIFYSDQPTQLFTLPFVSASKKMIDETVDFLFELQPATSDDSFNKTVHLALTLFNIFSGEKAESSKNEKIPLNFGNHQKMIVIIGSGRFTNNSGTQKELLTQIKTLNVKRVFIHAIGFGGWSGMNLLRRVTSQNHGYFIRVLHGYDTTFQISNFIEEVTNPVMLDVSFRFDKEKVSNCTASAFDVIFGGTEVIVAGRINDNTTTQSSKSIQSQIHGSSTNEELTFDFEISTKVTSGGWKIREIKESTKKLWVIVKINQLLNQLKTAADEIEISQINSEIKNLAINFNYVTPLTSLVITQNNRRQVINQAPTSDDNSINFNQTLIGPQPLLGRPFSDAILPTGPGFYGDPHFVIPIDGDVYLCFNWNSAEEVYNILYDEKRKVSINAKIATKVNQENSSKPATFITALSFIFEETDFILIVHTENITFKSRVDDNGFTVPVNEPFSIVSNDITITISDVTKYSAKVQISLKNLFYQVVLRKNNGYHQTHLDFSIGSPIETSNTYKGIIGQFLNAKVQISPESNGEKASLNLNGKQGMVKKHSSRNPASIHHRVPCWLSTRATEELFSQDESFYLVEGLLKRPNYKTS